MPVSNRQTPNQASQEHPKDRSALACQGLISIVIPVYREPDLIQSIERLLQQTYPEFEVLVIDSDPAGQSIAPLQQAQAAQPERYRRLKTAISPKPGRGPQMNLGAEQAQGQIVLFLHADTQLPTNALQSISECLRHNPEWIGGAFDLGIAASGMIYRILENVSSWRSRCTRLPYGDQSLFYRRQRFLEIGAFPDWPLMEDLGIGQTIKHKGLQIGILPMRSWTSARRWQQEGWAYTTLRNWALLLLYFAGVSPQRLAKWYK